MNRENIAPVMEKQTITYTDESELIQTDREWITSVLGKYDVSYSRGFLPDINPLVMV